MKVASGTDRAHLYQTLIGRGLDSAGPDPTLKLLPGDRPAREP